MGGHNKVKASGLENYNNGEFAYIVAYWLGDGVKVGPKKSQLPLSFAVGGDKEVENLQTRLHKIKSDLGTVRVNKQTFTVTFNQGQPVVKAIKTEIKNPSIIFKYPWHFVAGFLDSDGSVDLPYNNSSLPNHEQKSIRLCFFNTNKEYLLLVQSVLDFLDISSTFVDYTPYKNGVNPHTNCNAKKCYRLHITNRADLYVASCMLKNISTKSDRMVEYMKSYESIHKIPKIKINEWFYSIQGEIDVGMPALFIRVSGCDMNPPCDFCDTKYAQTQGDGVSISHLAAILDTHQKTHIGYNVVWTGGSPSLYMLQIVKVMITSTPYRHYLETNGLKYFDDCKLFRGISVSPKKQDWRIRVLEQFAKLEQSRFKFVYEDANDKWWEEIIDKLHLDCDKVWIMPEGATRQEQLDKSQEVIEYCKDNGYNFATRLHVLVYDNQRGV